MHVGHVVVTVADPFALLPCMLVLMHAMVLWPLLSCLLFLFLQLEKMEEANSARERLAGMAGTSSAFYDLDSDGFGLKSRENIKAMALKEADTKEVEKALKEKARYRMCCNPTIATFSCLCIVSRMHCCSPSSSSTSVCVLRVARRLVTFPTTAPLAKSITLCKEPIRSLSEKVQ